MTGTPRWRLLLPLALLATVLAPALRALPGGAWLPDVWLLLAFGAIPVPAPFAWRRAVGLVLLLALLRASVSSISLPVTLAGLGGAVCARDLLHRALRGHWRARLAVGAAAAAVQAAFDELAARRLGAPPGLGLLSVRVAGAALFWALWPPLCAGWPRIRS